VPRQALTYNQSLEATDRVWRQQSGGNQSLEATESGGNRAWRHPGLGGNSVNHANGRRVTSSHVLRTGRSEHNCFGVKNANGSRATHVFANRGSRQPVWRQQSLGPTVLGANSVNHANGRRVTTSHVLRTGRIQHVCFGVKNANGSRVTHVFENRGCALPDLCRAMHLLVP